MTGRFVLNPARAKVMGVCAGLSDWLGIDVLVVRLGAVVLTVMTGPVALLVYFVTGWLATDER